MKINWESKPILTILFIMVIVSSSIMIFGLAVLIDRPKVVAGQRWIYDSCSGDPFRDPCPVENEVLDVKNGYVKYKDLRSGIIDSNRISYFLLDSTLKR